LNKAKSLLELYHHGSSVCIANRDGEVICNSKAFYEYEDLFFFERSALKNNTPLDLHHAPDIYAD